jgi:hypothetical protein
MQSLCAVIYENEVWPDEKPCIDADHSGRKRRRHGPMKTFRPVG